MKILYIDHYAGSKKTGMEYRPFYLGREFVRAGHDCLILAGSYSHLRQMNPEVARDLEESEEEGLRYLWLKTRSYRGNGVGRVLSIFDFCSKIYRYKKAILERGPFDLVISSSTYPMDALPARRLARACRARYIHEVHDVWPASLIELGGMSTLHPFVLLTEFAERYAYRHADGLVSLLSETETYMRRKGLRAPWICLPNGLPREAEDPGSIQALPEVHQSLLRRLKEEGRFIYVYAGGHALSNHLDLLLDAARALAARGEAGKMPALVLVGDGVEKQRLQRRREEEGLANVFFLDKIPRTAIPSLLAQADASVICSQASSLYRFGTSLNKLYDVMGAGLPLVYAVPEPAPLVARIHAGLTLSEAEMTGEGLAAALLRLAATPETERREMGQRGARYIREHLRYEMIARSFLEFVEGL